MSYETVFAGSIPELYDRHMGPVLFEPYAIDAAARVPAGARVLEIACGTGRVTRHLAARASEVIATDLNEAMIARAREVVDDPRVSWRTADAQALPLGDGEVDAVVFQFGLMFVPDKARAMREVKRVLRPGGVAVISVWDTLAANPASQFFHEHALATFPDDPPTFMATPFSLGDPRELQALADGFAEARVETVAKIGEAVSADDFAIGLVRGNPFWNQLVERGHDAEAFQRSVAAGLAERFGDRPCRSALSVHVLTAY